MSNNIDKSRKLFESGRWSECIQSCLKNISRLKNISKSKNMLRQKNISHQNVSSIESIEIPEDKAQNAIEIWQLCSFSYANLGRLQEAIECLYEALKIDEKQGKIHNFNLNVNLAELYRRNNMVLQAISLLRSFLPKSDENLHFNLAKCYADLKDYEKSIQHYTIAVQINPKDIHAIYNLANQEANLGRFSLALKYYTLAYDSGLGDAGINLAQIHVNFDNLKSALQIYGDLEPRYTKDSNFYFNYGNALKFDLQFDMATQSYYKSIALKFSESCAINFAHLLLSLNDYENGFLLYEHRRSLIQDFTGRSAVGYLQDSRRDSDIYSTSGGLKRHFLDFNFDSKSAMLDFLKSKKIALYHEQGFGDSIMFARFIPLLQCREKILFLPRELENLFSCFEIPCYTSFHNDYDIAIPLPSLAYIFANERSVMESLQGFRDILVDTLESKSPQDCIHSHNSIAPTPIKKILESYEIDSKDIENKIIENSKNPKNQAYKLQIITSNLESKKHKNESKLDSIFNSLNPSDIKIGLNFMSNPKFQNAREKSIYPQKLLESLSSFMLHHKKSHPLRFFSLQYEGIDSSLTRQFGVMDLSEFISDFSDSRRVLQRLDLVITIDSALAHLSATLGIPTAILLHKRHDWRWGKLGDLDLPSQHPSLCKTGALLNDSLKSEDYWHGKEKTKSLESLDAKSQDSIHFGATEFRDSKNPRFVVTSASGWYDNIYLFKQKKLNNWDNVFSELNGFLREFVISDSMRGIFTHEKYANIDKYNM